jgi:hypothetical protein
MLVSAGRQMGLLLCAGASPLVAKVVVLDRGALGLTVPDRNRSQCLARLESDLARGFAHKPHPASARPRTGCAQKRSLPFIHGVSFISLTHVRQFWQANSLGGSICDRSPT